MVSATLGLALMSLLGAGRMPRGLPQSGDPCKDSCALSRQVCEKSCTKTPPKNVSTAKCLADCSAKVPDCQQTCTTLLPLAREQMRRDSATQPDGGAR